VFEHLAAAFEKRHAGVKVRLSFAGSQELRIQIEQGARVDIFASADERHMAALRKQGLVRAETVFARNRPVLVVPLSNPAKLARFADLPKARHVVVGSSEVPIGAYAEKILAAADRHYGRAFRARVLAHVQSRELNARQVLAKVALGEADAGIVYRTDALAMKDRGSTIAIPSPINTIANYPVAMATAAATPDLAEAWVGFVTSKAGQDALAAAGFLGAPPTAANASKP